MKKILCDYMQLGISPVQSDKPLEELKLIPYGCTNLRVTEFPVLQWKATTPGD